MYDMTWCDSIKFLRVRSSSSFIVLENPVLYCIGLLHIMNNTIQVVQALEVMHLF